MKFKESRGISFFLLAVIYILASVAGIVSYPYMPGDFRLKLLLADVIATVFTFLFSVLLGNASVYDPYWSVQPIVILFAFLRGQSLTPLSIAVTAVVTLWGLRLTANWAYTFHGLTHQDWRYTMLHDTTGIAYPLINFVGIHMVPTLVVYGCTLPAVYMLQSDAKLSPLVCLPLLLSVCAFTMQGTADIQMHRFRRKKQGGFIRVGLWKYSRHPNYLGEILMWWGIALSAVAALGFRWDLVAGAAANTLLFLTVSIPMADRRQGKKPGFGEYKRQTRMLLPIKKL